MSDKNADFTLTAKAALARGQGETCPACGLVGEYGSDEAVDDVKWQDATCPNGHAWREIWSFTHIVMLDPETNDEIGDVFPVISKV